MGRRLLFRSLSRVKKIVLFGLSWRVVRNCAWLCNDEHERRCITTQIDFHHLRLRTTKANHPKIADGLTHIESTQERTLRVGTRRRSRLRCVMLLLCFTATTHALYSNDRRDDRDAQRRNASFHENPHDRDNLRPRFASDISSRDS